jgi:hypothetical protein
LERIEFEAKPKEPNKSISQQVKEKILAKYPVTTANDNNEAVKMRPRTNW